MTFGGFSPLSFLIAFGSPFLKRPSFFLLESRGQVCKERRGTQSTSASRKVHTGAGLSLPLVPSLQAASPHGWGLGAVSRGRLPSPDTLSEPGRSPDTLSEPGPTALPPRIFACSAALSPRPLRPGGFRHAVSVRHASCLSVHAGRPRHLSSRGAQSRNQFCGSDAPQAGQDII